MTSWPGNRTRSHSRWDSSRCTSPPGRIVAAAAQDTAEAPNFTQPEAKSRQEVLETFSKSTASARTALKGMDDARLMSTWRLVRNGKPVMEVPRIAFLRSILMNHTYHHRGQLS